jgi:DNA-binding PadR family transcriptional regulator
MTPSIPTFVVLGLLAKRPGSGYDIVAFAERSVSFFWPLSRSQLYTELSRLEEMGWATGTAVEQDRYPNKRVYQPTPAGMTALREWLDAPAVPQKQRTRDPLVLKTFLGSLMNADRLADQLRGHRDEAAALQTKLLSVIAHIESLDDNASRRFGRATARYGVLQAEATIAWIEEVQALLAAEAASCRPMEARQTDNPIP